MSTLLELYRKYIESEDEDIRTEIENHPDFQIFNNNLIYNIYNSMSDSVICDVFVKLIDCYVHSEWMENVTKRHVREAIREYFRENTIFDIDFIIIYRDNDDIYNEWTQHGLTDTNPRASIADILERMASSEESAAKLVSDA